MATTVGTNQGTGATEIKNGATVGISVDTSGRASFPTGVAITDPVYQGSAKAWVNFGWNGSAIVIRASYNVSSVVRVGAGIYNITFTNSITDTNYTVVTSARLSGNSTASCALPDVLGTTTQVQVSSFVTTNGSAIDVTYFNVAVFR